MELENANVKPETPVPPELNDGIGASTQQGEDAPLYIGIHPQIVKVVAKNSDGVEVMLFDVEKLPKVFPPTVYLHNVGNPKTFSTAQKVLQDLGVSYTEVAFKPNHLKDKFAFREVLAATAKVKASGTTETPTKKKLVELEKASVKGMLTKKPPEPSFLLLNLIRRAITGFLEGAGGTSKSMWLIQLQVCLAIGRLFLGKFPVASEGIGSSFVIYGEETSAELHARLFHLCQVMELTPKEITKVEARVFMYSAVDDDYNPVLSKTGNGEAEPTAFIDQMLNTLEEVDDLVFVGIDPLAKFYGANLMDSKDGYRYTQELKKICKAKGATVLTLNHINKAGLRDGGSAAAAGYGSVAFRDSSRIMINMTVMTAPQAKLRGIEPDDREFYVQMSITKNNYVPPAKSETWLHRGEHGVLSYVELNLIPDEESMAAQDWKFVLDYIKDGAANGQQYGKTDLMNAAILGESCYPISKLKKAGFLQDLLNKGKLKTESVKVPNNNKLKDVYVVVAEEPQKVTSPEEVAEMVASL